MIVTELKNLSEAALGRLGTQFGDLPAPLLAAVGASDVALDHLAHLRDYLTGGQDQGGDSGDGAPGGDDDIPGDADDERHSGGGRFAGADAEARRVLSAAESAVRRLARDVPDRAQQALADLPARAQEVANSLQPGRLRETASSASRRVTDAVSDLVERGRTHVREATEARAEGAAADAADRMRKGPSSKGAAADSRARSAESKSAKSAAPATSAARKPAAQKPAARKPAARIKGAPKKTDTGE